jgi:hypothetical protein
MRQTVQINILEPAVPSESIAQRLERLEAGIRERDLRIDALRRHADAMTQSAAEMDRRYQQVRSQLQYAIQVIEQIVLRRGGRQAAIRAGLGA